MEKGSGIIEWAEQLKQEGKIRHLGFSFHDDYEVFEEIINYRDWDFCQIQLNYIDTDTSDKNQNNGTTGEQNNDTSAITSPETGDKMNLVLWIALLVVSASTVIGTAVVNRKTI